MEEPMTTLLARRRGPARVNRQVAYTAWAWVVVFTAFHAYWYSGGRFGLGDAPNLLPGSADPSANTVWSGRAVDWYFTLGGLLFAAAALTYRRTLAISQRRR
jgi:hypothetical protein